VTRGQLEANNVVSRRHAPLGSLTTESILIFGSVLPFAGQHGTEGLGRFARAKGLQPFEQIRTDDRGMLEGFSRRGAFIHLAMRRRMRGAGRSFTRRHLGSRETSSSSQPAVAASSDWVGSAPAKRWIEER
jgi:hypothetical protein